MFDKEARYPGFWLLSDVLLNQGLLFLTSFCPDICLPVNGEENYIWSHKRAIHQINRCNEMAGEHLKAQIHYSYVLIAYLGFWLLRLQ